jgi:hypothetical protein
MPFIPNNMHLQESCFDMDEDVLAMGGQLCTILSKCAMEETALCIMITIMSQSSMQQPLNHAFVFLQMSTPK